MSPTWVAFLTAAIVWLPLGFMAGAKLASMASKHREERAHQDGVERGIALGRKAVWCQMEGDLRRRVVQDIISDDTAAAFAEPRKPAA